MKYLLGIDLGSSSVKVSLVEIESGQCVASAHYPETEAPIKALQPGWAEQRPDDWWEYFKQALEKVKSEKLKVKSVEVAAIGISYQMHGLVCLDKDLKPLRDAIIWCDSRGVPYGEHAPLPGNFTAAKLAWVKEHEPALFERIKYIMLPGDYLALRLTGTPATTACGLSEMMLLDFGVGSEECVVGSTRGQMPPTTHYPLSTRQMEYFGFPMNIIPPLVPTFGEQGRLTESAAKELGLNAGTPVTYRAGDQPNNALSLRVLHPGEIASTAGTSGVVYGIHLTPDPSPRGEGSEMSASKVSTPLSFGEGLGVRPINTFLHVNHTLGLMHCINGCGILNSWLKHNVSPDIGYDEMNALAATVPVGSEGVSIIPFGNGAERVLGNKDIGASIHGLNFNRHTRAHLLRAAQEGIAFAFMYGMEQMKSEKLKVKSEKFADAANNSQFSIDSVYATASRQRKQAFSALDFRSSLNSQFNVIHAGRANMFLSPIFRDTLASISGATIHLYDTDGSVGAARGAGLGAGIYANEDEAFASLKQLATIAPRKDYEAPLQEAYQRWKEILNQNIGQ